MKVAGKLVTDYREFVTEYRGRENLTTEETGCVFNESKIYPAVRFQACACDL